MTLSFWLRDYVFKPLHSRMYKHTRHLAIILTMTISGLWHGAAWTFVLWGLIQGLIMSAEQAYGYSRFAQRACGGWKVLCICRTFLLWSFLAVIFRAPNLQVAYDVAIRSLTQGGWGPWPDRATVPVIAGGILLLLHPFDQMEKIRGLAAKIPAPLLLPVLGMMIVAAAAAASFAPQDFYYFDF